MDISDFADVADSDDQLEELVHDLHDAAADILVDVDLPRTQVSELQGTGGEAKHVRIERPSLGPIVRDVEWLDDIDEAIDFADHLSEEYDYSIDQHYLTNLFKDSFGRAGQHLDSYQEGDFFDLPMLKNRPVCTADGPAGDGLAGDLKTIIESAKSVDLGAFAAEVYGYGTGLDDLIQHQEVGLRRTFFDDYAHELDLQRIRPADAATDYVDSGDIPGMRET